MRAELDKDDTKLTLQAEGSMPAHRVALMPQLRDDRSQCATLRSDLKEAADAVASFEKEVATKRVAVAAFK